MPLTSLTDRDALDRYLSAQGVVSFGDHDADGVGDEDVIGECIDYASAYVAGALAQRYKPAALSAAPVIREVTTVIACRTLCLRRGNPIPESLEMRFQELVAADGYLVSLAKGSPKLMGDDGEIVVGTSGYAPTFANLTVDRLYTQEQIRVRQGSSSGQSTKLERDIAREWSNG